jgi:hypothetical protein
LTKPITTKNSQKNEEIITAKPEQKTNIFGTIISIVFFVVAFVIGRFLGLVTFIFIGAWALGEWFPKWYMKREKVNASLIKGLAQLTTLNKPL